ncbi:uncharacterized protein si:dkey-187a12.4 isoform X1 [Xiphias gladius]|uniref:uncharacterized protein si:dkey-187a12.4 isoform X1 n=1 Tax=Xiphias gladius TaxID=8245 RepID=UPI001A9985DB|nr:uncharacterized protein si:dkey-187a12.4 isoform X1 [Xiphias gladius]
MEHDNGDNYDWSTERRVEGLVNKHMADIALETLQQRLTAVSDEMHSLAEHVSRRSGEELKDEPRRADVSLGVEPPLSSACSSGAADNFISACSTEIAAQRKIIALLVEIKEEQQRQWAVLRDLQARLLAQTSYEEEDVEALDKDLPLRTLEQLDEMERRLEEPGIQKRLVSYLSRMGGATVDDAVRRLMQAVLSFAVGSELNWVGRGQKRSFRNTRLQGVLFLLCFLVFPLSLPVTFCRYFCSWCCRVWIRDCKPPIVPTILLNTHCFNYCYSFYYYHDECLCGTCTAHYKKYSLELIYMKSALR